MTQEEFNDIVFRIHTVFNNHNHSNFTKYYIIDKYFSTLDGGGDLTINVDGRELGGTLGETNFPINDQELYFMGESYKNIDEFERTWYG